MISVLRQGPTQEPISVSDLRAYLHLDDNEDGLLASLITSARLMVEAQAGVRLIRQEWDAMFDAWPGDGIIQLPHWPILEIAAIRLLGDTPQNISSATYELITNTRPAVLMPRASKNWPHPLRPRLGIMLTIISGYGDNATSIPEALRHAVKTLAAHWYETNEWNNQSIASAIPQQVSALMHPFRTLRV